MAKKFCAKYPLCRKDPASRCGRNLCGTCCDRSSPCHPANHDKHGNKSRGTSRPSDAKRQRRSGQAMLQAMLDKFSKTNPWFADRLQITGYTLRKFTFLMCDHIMLMASEIDRSHESTLSFTLPPAELMLVEEEIDPVMHMLRDSKAELLEIAEHERNANHEMKEDHVYGMVIDPTIVESISCSFEHIELHNVRFELIAWRQELFQRLRSPASERLLQHGRSVGLTHEAIVRLVNKVCPLPFVDEAQYHTFSDELADRIRDKMLQFQSKLMPTAAGSLSGFQIIFLGTSATLYSETPGVKRGRLFDEVGKGQSDIDVAIVFETGQSQSHRQSQALVEAIFFGTPSKSAAFKSIQYAAPQVTKRFQLAEHFLPSWQATLGRHVSVNVAYSSRTHGNGVLTFHRHYDFSWDERFRMEGSGCAWWTPVNSDRHYEGSGCASSTPVSSVYPPARPIKSFEDLIRPEPQNKRPTRQKKDDPHPHEVYSHYQRDHPKRFNSASRHDIWFLDRGLDTPDITFDKMTMWLQARGVFECFRDVNMKEYEWAPDPKWPDKHRHGVWFKCRLRQQAILPALSKNKIGVWLNDDGNLVVPTSYHRWWGSEFQKGIHASSMYQVKRTLTTGLHTGKAKKNGVEGIYCYNMKNYKLANKSVGYALYSELFEDNVFWAPYYELQIMRSCANTGAIGKITAGDQWICKEHLVPSFGPMFHMTAVWFHALPLHHVGKDGCNWVSLDQFLKPYELD